MGDRKLALIVIQVVLGVKICLCCALLTIKWLLECNDQFAEQKNPNTSWALDTKPTFGVEEAAFGMKQIEHHDAGAVSKGYPAILQSVKDSFKNYEYFSSILNKSKKSEWECTWSFSIQFLSEAS